jgi:hypothetical protein
MRIGSNTREGELRHVGFTNDHCAGFAKPLDYWSISLCRRCVCECDRARPRRFAGDVEKVLDADDGSIERSKRDAIKSSSVGCIGSFASLLRIEAEKGALALAAGIEDAGKSSLKPLAC